MIAEDVQLKHRLTDKEIAELAREQSLALQERTSLENELVSVKKMYASKQAEADAKISGISVRVSTGFEMRTVRCMLCDERPEGFRLTVRLDTGHVVRRRKLEQHERQITITTEPPRPFIAVAILPVDDENWDVDMCQIPIREDEFEALRNIPDLKFDQAPITPKAMLSGNVDEGKKKAKK